MFSLNATLPVFLVIVLGWFLMQKKMFNENFVDIINKFVFKVSLPVLLFKDIATTPIRDAFDPKFVIFCMIGTTIMFMGIWVTAQSHGCNTGFAQLPNHDLTDLFI